jgi:hypothetical protein
MAIEEIVKPDTTSRRHPWRLVLVVGVAVVAAVGIALASVVPFSSEAARAGIVAFLGDRLDGDVELEDVTLQLFPQLRAEGHGLKIRHRGRRDVPPLISITHFSAEGSIANLLRKHVTHLTVEGLDVEIPPDRNRDAGADDGDAHQRTGRDKSDREDTARTIVVDEMISTDARIVIIPGEPDKPPRVWAIHRLRMHNLGVHQPMPFEATLTNAVPPGDISTSGVFGPWHAEVPGQTPLDGTFEFDRADLGFFKGISGILSARGSFGGSLARIDIHGETDTPQFAVAAAGNPIPLHTLYHAIVDGTNGNTLLDSVNGSFLSTSLIAKGRIVDTPGHAGRTVMLDITMVRARLEDVLKLAVKASTPPMRGGLVLKTRFVLPPGDSDVVSRLRLDGRFAIAGTRFTDAGVQEKINELSRRSQGHPADQNASRVASQFNGTFKLSGGTLKIPEVTFGVPGSTVRLAGSYDLVPETMNFAGTLVMDATISQTTTGFKSKLLKVVDPIFEKRGGGGSEIPLKISGTRNNPSFGIDKGRLFRRRKQE